MRFELVEQRALAVLEDEVEPLLAPEHLDQVDEVRVLEVLQHADLAEGDLADERVVLGLLEPLDGHHGAAVLVAAFVHVPVRALADLAELLVLLRLG